MAGLDRLGRAVGDEADLAVKEGAELHDAIADFMQHLAAERAERFRRLGGDDRRDPLESVLGDGRGGKFLGETGGRLGLVSLQLLFEFLLVGQDQFEFLGDVLHAGVEPGADDREGGFFGSDMVKRGLAGDGLDAAGAGGDGHLGDDLDDADLAGGGHVRAAAEFLGIAADVDDADALAVFVAEEGEHVIGLLVVVDLVDLDRGVLQDLPIDELLALLDLRVGQRLEMGEVEAHPVGGLVRAELADMRAKHLAQRPVDQMGGGVVAVDRPAAVEIDVEGGRSAGSRERRVGGNLVQMAAGLVLAAIDEVDLEPADKSVARIADLTAHLGVEGRLVEHKVGVLLGFHDLDQLGMRGVGGVDLVAGELGRLGLGVALGGGDDDVGLARRPAAFALLRH